MRAAACCWLAPPLAVVVVVAVEVAVATDPAGAGLWVGTPPACLPQRGGIAPPACRHAAQRAHPPRPAPPRLSAPSSRSIQQSVQLLLQRLPATRVLILGVLPRGTGSGKGGKLGTNDMSWPSHYAKAIASTNALLK